MSNKKGDYPIPFDYRGNQQDYPTRMWHMDKPKDPVWVDNFEFDDTLTLEVWGRGRSSITFHMRRTNGCTVSVFVSDFCAMARSKEFKAGSITGRFTFSKRGQNYGCRLADEQPKAKEIAG